VPAIQKLNPRVTVKTDISTIEHRDAEFFKQFAMVIVTEADLNTLVAINKACREADVAFYAGGCYGLYGYAFADLIKHQFIMYGALLLKRLLNCLHCGTMCMTDVGNFLCV
jgi:ubiquitin-like 1-activating enzyme E1 A